MKNWLIRLFVAVVLTTVLVGTASAEDELKPRYFRLKIDLTNGEVKKIWDEHDRDAKELNAGEYEEFLKKDYVYAASIFYTHQSPGCITIIIGGKAFQLCNFP